MREAIDGVISFPGVSREVMLLCLEYVYTGVSSISPDLAEALSSFRQLDDAFLSTHIDHLCRQELLYTSDMLGIDGLHRMSQEYLSKRIEETNVLDMATLAQETNASLLLDACVESIVTETRLHLIVSDPRFQSFTHDHGTWRRLEDAVHVRLGTEPWLDVDEECGALHEPVVKDRLREEMLDENFRSPSSVEPIRDRPQGSSPAAVTSIFLTIQNG